MLGRLGWNGILAALRFAAPQVLTSLRIVLAIFAMVLSSRGQVGTAAALLLFGFVTDVLDGACARLLGVATEFGQLFDFFADYLYFVVAPAAISWQMAEPGGTAALLLLSLPCVCAALRYARKAGLSETEYPGIPASPGVPTIAYALFVIALALLWRDQAMARADVRNCLTFGAPALGLLMVVRTRYPKLSAYLWILIPILGGLMAMPFVLTPVLARATLVLIGFYVLLGPAMVPQAGRGAVRRAGARRAERGEGV